MGARRKHPCFLRSRKPAPADPPESVGCHGKSQNHSSASASRSRCAFALPWQRHTVNGGSGRVCGGVSRMDAATKPPRMGSRRPPQTRTVPPSQGNCWQPAVRHKSSAAGRSPANQPTVECRKKVAIGGRDPHLPEPPAAGGWKPLPPGARVLEFPFPLRRPVPCTSPCSRPRSTAPP